MPNRFEAGLQDYANLIALGEACRYLKKVGLANIAKHEIKLNTLITNALITEPKISLLGPKDPSLRSGVFSFTVKGMDIHHVSGILNKSKNIMVRSGAHCVHSWFNAHNMKGSVRASLYLYNTEEEIKVFVEEVKKILTMI